LDALEFKAGLDRANDRFLTGSGRIAGLTLFTDYARIVFDIHRGRSEYLKDYTSEEIRDYADIFPDLTPYIDRYGPREGYWRWTRSLPRKLNRLLYHQLLVFLVTIFEAFVADALLVAFRREPKCLSTGRTIAWERVINLGNYDSVIDYFAREKVAGILSGDWYKIADELRTMFNIDLSADTDPRSVAEIFEIRHAVVHNVALADQRFISKVGASEWGLKYSINKEIVINQRALKRMTSYIEYVTYTIYEALLKKFGAP